MSTRTLFYLLWKGAETFLLVQGAHSQKNLQRAINLPLLFSWLLLPCSCAVVHLLPKASANMRKGTYNYKQVSELTRALTASKSAFSPYSRQPTITGKKEFWVWNICSCNSEGKLLHFSSVWSSSGSLSNDIQLHMSCQCSCSGNASSILHSGWGW